MFCAEKKENTNGLNVVKLPLDDRINSHTR
jgi:hypothetical protein